MKKIALVAAIAAFAAPAVFAQSSVTLWGRMNTTVESQSNNGGDRLVAVQNNSSRLGFKGTEDLGGGLKVQFLLEHGLKSDSGAANGPFWNREAAVQLSGNFGAVKLGRWTNGSYFATADYISMHNHDTGTSSDALYAFGTGWTEANKVGYFTPNYAGFSAEITASAGEGAPGAKRAFDLSANYDMGPLHLGAGYGKQGDGNQFAVRGLYEMGAFTFGAYWQREDNKAGYKASRNIGRVSAMYAMGASEFHVNVGGTEGGGTAGFGGHGAKQYTLGYNYNLSKRTKVYGFYTAIESNAPKNMGDFDSIAAGIRHNF